MGLPPFPRPNLGTNGLLGIPSKMIMVLKRRNTTAPVEDVGDVQGVDRISGDGLIRWGDIYIMRAE
jgi:hypothetical protein